MVVTSLEIKPTGIDEISELAEMQEKAVEAILRRVSSYMVLAGITADITGQLLKMSNINKAIYGSETEEN